MEQTTYHYTQDTLLKLIEAKRSEMLFMAKQYGMDSEASLRLSQELDDLILDFQARDRGIIKESSHQEKNLTEKWGSLFSGMTCLELTR